MSVSRRSTDTPAQMADLTRSYNPGAISLPAASPDWT